MSTETLTDWLLRQVAADERPARYAMTRDALNDRDTEGWWVGHYQHYIRHTPARVLAECEAKRLVVALHSEARYGGCAHCVDPEDPLELEGWPCSTLLILALPYADRPGYLEEWRP